MLLSVCVMLIGEFTKQFAEIWLFDLIKTLAAILGGISPRIGIGADKAAHWRLTVAEIQKLISDYLIDDCRNLARRFAAFALQLPLGVFEFVNHAFEDADEDHILGAGVL